MFQSTELIKLFLLESIILTSSDGDSEDSDEDSDNTESHGIEMNQREV